MDLVIRVNINPNNLEPKIKISIAPDSNQISVTLCVTKALEILGLLDLMRQSYVLQADINSVKIPDNKIISERYIEHIRAIFTKPTVVQVPEVVDMEDYKAPSVDSNPKDRTDEAIILQIADNILRNSSHPTQNSKPQAVINFIFTLTGVKYTAEKARDIMAAAIKRARSR